MELNKEEHVLPIDQIINMPLVKELVPAIQEQLLSGKYSTLKASIFFKKIEKVSKQLNEGEKGRQLKEQIEKEIRSYQEGKTSDIYGVKIREQDRSFFDYSECGDPIWEKLKDIKGHVEELIKIRETELKLTIPKPGLGLPQTQVAVPYMPELVLHENNDLVNINPPLKGAKTIFAYFL